MPTFNTKQRKLLAKKGLAMPDGGYPIRNISDLKNAISSYGRGNNKPEVKRWIKKRAKELNAENLLPDNWRTESEHSAIYYGGYLQHYGIKGMKWGVRRYQNKDGSLTAEGKARERKKTSGWSKDAKEARRLKRKSVNQLTNQELRTLNNRLNLEDNYKRLNPSKVDRGLKYLGAAAAGMGTILTLERNSEKFIKLGKKFYKAIKK